MSRKSRSSPSRCLSPPKKEGDAAGDAGRKPARASSLSAGQGSGECAGEPPSAMPNRSRRITPTAVVEKPSRMAVVENSAKIRPSDRGILLYQKRGPQAAIAGSGAAVPCDRLPEATTAPSNILPPPTPAFLRNPLPPSRRHESSKCEVQHPAVPPPVVSQRLFSGFLLQAGVFSSVQRAEELACPADPEWRSIDAGNPRSGRTIQDQARGRGGTGQAATELGVETILVPPKGKESRLQGMPGRRGKPRLRRMSRGHGVTRLLIGDYRNVWPNSPRLR